MDEVIDGINRRQAGIDEEFREGCLCALQDILQRDGLPSSLGSNDRDYLGFLAEVAELIERATDAGEADRRSECYFIERQINAAIRQAKERWGGTANLVHVRIML